jgi:hypothetical protein
MKLLPQKCKKTGGAKDFGICQGGEMRQRQRRTLPDRFGSLGLV